MPAPLLVLSIALAAAVACSDLYARRVPNRWLLLALVLGVIWLGFNATPGLQLAHAMGLSLGLLVLLPFYAVGWMGAGDVKFFAVLGALLGWQALLPIWIVASLLAGAYAVFVIVARRAPQIALLASVGERWRHSRLAQASARARAGRQGAPYATFLAIGTLAAMFWPLY